MMNFFRRILFLLILCIMFIPVVYANEDKNLVNIYLFYSDSCIHCSYEMKMLDELEEEYGNIKIYKYEINDTENMELFRDVSKLYGLTNSGVPCTFIGDMVYNGYSERESKLKFVATIDYYSKYGYVDKVGEYIGNIELPIYQVSDEVITIDEYVDNYGNYIISFLGFDIETKNLSLPVVSILIGLVDGFSLGSILILIFLISILMGIEDKKKMWILGITFLLTSALIYLLLILIGLDVSGLLIYIRLIELFIGLVVIILSFSNIYSYFRNKDTNGNKENKICSKINRFIGKRNLNLSIMGIIVLAVFVNVLKFTYSSLLPNTFMKILFVNNLNIVEEVIYIALYMLFFLIDDLVIFFISIRTIQLASISLVKVKLFKLIGGILLLIIGLLIFFKPEWLIFCF